MFDKSQKNYFLKKLFLTVWLSVLFSGIQGYSQDEPVEEIVVGFNVPKLLHRDIFVQYDGMNIYAPIVEIFNQLDINIEPDFVNGKFKGFYCPKQPPGSETRNINSKKTSVSLAEGSFLSGLMFLIPSLTSKWYLIFLHYQ